MKKEVKAIIAVVLAVWILLMGIEIGSLREKKKIAASNSTTEVSSTTTTQPTTQNVVPSAPDSAAIPGGTTQPSAPADATTAPTAPSAPADTVDVSTLTKEQIVAKVAEAVNKVKSEQNMTAHKTENISVNLTALSVESLRSLVNSIISSLVGEPTDETIKVANGIATYPDGSTKPIKEAIPPSNDATKDFALTADGVATATATKQGDNTVYTVVLVSETTTGASPIPTHNSKAIGYLNLMGLDLPDAVQIVDSNMQYTGSTVEVTVNAAGQVIKLVNKMPMKGDGTAKAKVGFVEVDGKAEFEGALDEVWEFTY